MLTCWALGPKSLSLLFSYPQRSKQVLLFEAIGRILFS